MNMRKTILLSAAFCLAVSVGFAQLSYGIKGGLNLASISNTPASHVRPAFYAGAFADYRLNDLVDLGVELLYSAQGVNTRLDYIPDTKILTYRNDYLTLPVLAKVHITDDLSLDLGPQFGLLLSAKDKIEGQDPTDAMKYLNKFDLSAALGMTYNFGKVFVQGRYTLGLTNEAKKKFEEGEGRMKNMVVQLGAGYRF